MVEANDGEYEELQKKIMDRVLLELDLPPCADVSAAEAKITSAVHENSDLESVYEEVLRKVTFQVYNERSISNDPSRQQISSKSKSSICSSNRQD